MELAELNVERPLIQICEKMKTFRQVSRSHVTCSSFTRANTFSGLLGEKAPQSATAVAAQFLFFACLLLMSMLETSAWFWGCSCGCQSCLPVIGNQHRHGGQTLHNWASHNGSLSCWLCWGTPTVWRFSSALVPPGVSVIGNFYS